MCVSSYLMQDRAYLLNANGVLDYAHDSSTSFSYSIQSFKAVIRTDLVELVFIPFDNEVSLLELFQTFLWQLIHL